MLLWREPLDVTILAYTSGHIDFKVIHTEKHWILQDFMAIRSRLIDITPGSYYVAFMGFLNYVNCRGLYVGTSMKYAMTQRKVEGIYTPYIKLKRSVMCLMSVPYKTYIVRAMFSLGLTVESMRR